MAYDLSTLQVVVVDDNEHALRLVRAILLSIGVGQLRLCKIASEALDELSRSPADLLLTDWDMPGMDGLELVQRLRGPESLHPFLPIIMFSGHSERARVLKARRMPG